MRAPGLALVLLVGWAVPATAQVAPQPLSLFTLGSAALDGGYHAVARALCDRVNRAELGVLRCSPEPTAGSLYNLTALRDRQLDFALAQSDWQQHAYRGTSVFARRGPDPSLRSVMSLYPEPFTLLARRQAAIASLPDLAGKRVDIGHPSSGRQATMRAVMEAFGLAADRFAETLELPTNSAIEALCSGRIDATVLIIGHPNAPVGRALAVCDVGIVPLTGPPVERLIQAGGSYSAGTIPHDAYPELARDVPSFAVMATLVTGASMDDAPVQALVRVTLEHLDWLRRYVPVLAGLDPAAMRTSGLTAPLHPAAAAAFDAFQAGRR